MPQIFRTNGYSIFFWSNEGIPQEPIHVHVTKGEPIPNATKLWITKKGRCIIANNNSKIPNHILNDIIEIIETRFFQILTKWKEMHGEPTFYC